MISSIRYAVCQCFPATVLAVSLLATTNKKNNITMMTPANNDSPDSTNTDTNTSTNTNTNTPLIPTRLTTAIRSSVASSITQSQTRRRSRGRFTNPHNAFPVSENEVIEHYRRLDVQFGVDVDNDESDGEVEPNEDGLDIGNNNEDCNTLDFITETNLNDRQAHRDKITENAATKEFGFENYWKFRNGTFLDKEHIPLTTKEGWLPKKRMTNEPAFVDVPNPGHWSEFVNRPFLWNGPYQHHRLPSGVVPVPESAVGQRKVNGWTVHYNGKFEVKKEDENVSWKYATIENSFPKEREGCLDVDKLKQFGMTKKQLNNPMLFYTLLNLIVDSKPSAGDGRRNYYLDVTRFTNVNLSLNEKPLQGHDVPKFSPVDLIKFDGVNFYHGAFGSGSDLHLRWDKTSCKYEGKIDECMGYAQWMEIKQYIKWNLNCEG